MRDFDSAGVVTIESGMRSLVGPKAWQKTALAWFYCSVGVSLMITSQLLKVEVQSS